VELAPHAVTMRISDDGCGLPPDAASRSGHYGMRGMRERLEGLGGTLTSGAEDHPRSGTRLARSGRSQRWRGGCAGGAGAAA
jgi:nitrate/nitrite-specific signal transduction histidine kinase